MNRPLLRSPHLSTEIWHGASRLLIAEAVGLPAGILISALLTHALGVAGYGAYSIGAAITAGIEWIIVAALARLAVQTLSAHPEAAPAFLRYFLALSSSAALLVVIAAPSIAVQLELPSLASELRWFACDIPLFALGQAQRCIFVARGEYSRRALSGALRWITRAAATGLAVWLHLGVAGAIAAWIAASIAELAYLRGIGLKHLLAPGVPLPPNWLSHALPLFLFAAGQRVFERIDLLMLKAEGVPVADTGVYAAAQNLAILPGMAAAALSPVLVSSLIRGARAGLHQQAREAAGASLRLTFALLPLSALFLAFGEPLAAFLFGEPFRHAGFLAAILTLGAVGLALAANCVSILSAEGEARLAWWFSIPALILSAVALYFVIPRYGLTGAAVVSAAAGMLPALAGVAFLYRHWSRS